MTRDSAFMARMSPLGASFSERCKIGIMHPENGGKTGTRGANYQDWGRPEQAAEKLGFNSRLDLLPSCTRLILRSSKHLKTLVLFSAAC
jgi:hypothetical protein